MAALNLETPVQYVQGVGPVRASQLAELGVITLGDLLTYFPRRFDLRRQVQPIDSLTGDEGDASVAGVVADTEYRPFGKLPYFACSLDDGSGWVTVKWFHGGYLRDKIKVGLHLAVSGKVSTYRECRQFLNPRFQIIWDPAGTNLDQDELMPVYPASGLIPSGWIARIIQQILPQVGRLIPEFYDAAYLRKRELPERATSIAAMHRPEDKDAWKEARRRLAYDELLLMQMGIALQRMRTVSRPAFPLPLNEEIDRRIRARLPFTLTSSQDKVLTEITGDLARNRPMNRLLQGDVGSGKTVVALYAALLAVAHRKQAAIMAPTEILARQHFNKVEQYLHGSKVRSAMLVGGQKQAERQQILAALAAGEINIIVGTHALISEHVQFHSLALVVMDEQHKFGVRQRVDLREKGHAPHCLVMTATPIPRTLALTVFGDLDVSVIDELPPGRGRTHTRLIDRSQMKDTFEFVRKHLQEGQQAYFVYPLVTGSEDVQITAAKDAYVQLTQVFPEFRVGLIHGQMPAVEQQHVMREFTSGAVRILAASTIVEVGLDVPNANVMVVTHAERFGLAQLHQLRGRIGRGQSDAVCLLVAGIKNPIASERLRVLTETSDGFKIAEADLRIRGPGEFFGTRQHGLPELKIADLIEDFDLLRMARRDAFGIVKDDPDLSDPGHQTLRAEMLRLYAERLGLVAG